MRLWLIPGVLAIAFLLTGCTTPGSTRASSLSSTPHGDPMTRVHTLLPAPPDFAKQCINGADFPIPPHAKYLAGVRVCLDPGHGGEAHKRGYKRGPTGVREAEVNLRVARYLRTLLETVHADVLLTREDDRFVGLAERAEMANQWNADLFLSIHHNAVDNNPDANYTSVWYHGDVDDRPANLDLARHICHALYEELRLTHLAGVPLKSDQLMYPSGFGVLAAADVTAALSESSFHSNPDQEQLLRDPHYNMREAYALFLGLARHAAGGLPRVSMLQPLDGVVSSLPTTLVFDLDDGLRSRQSWGHERTMILRDTIAVRVDDKSIPFTFADDGQRYRVRAELPADIEPGAHDVVVHFQNMFKNSVLNPQFILHIQP